MITMFYAHVVFSLELIVLVLAAALIVWAKAHANVGTGFPKFIGYLAVILAVLGLACTSYYTMRSGSVGYFSPQTKKCCMMGKCMMDNTNMDMKNRPMIKMQDGSGSMSSMKPMMEQKEMPNKQKT
ncbi:MAG: hypothetical protein A2X77_04625 [Gammaproteobacteria bacterium GWE2_42_36]|nr:MAG: hypothetical protein A2X77_04625 [Gammaproteobacteria bacterium GWE2_42_36]